MSETGKHENAAAETTAEAEAATASTTVEQTAVTEVAADAEVTGADAAGPPVDVKVVRRGSRRRGFFVVLLVVLSCLSLVVTGVAWWAHYTVFNTSGYMKVVGPVGKDPAAIKSLSDYVAGQVVSATNLQQRASDALPPKLQFLSGPLASEVDKLIAQGTEKVLSTPKAYAAWLKINEFAHAKVVALLRGNTTYTYIQGSDVKLDTLPLISQVLVWIDGKLPGALGARFSAPVIAPGTPPTESIQQIADWTGRTLPGDFGQITLLKSDSLGPAQAAVRLFDTLVWVLLVVTIVLIAVTIWLSRRRRRTLIELGIGAAIALILTHVIAKQGSAAIVNGLHGGSTVTVLRNVVNSSLNPLTALTIWIVVLGVVVAVAAWLSGRHDVQVAVVTASKRVGQATSDAHDADSPITGWIARYASWLRIAGVVAGLILLLVATSSWWGIVLWVVVVLVYEAVISFLIGDWPFGRRVTEEDAAA